jgi:S1-C subfamily serine protease
MKSVLVVMLIILGIPAGIGILSYTIEPVAVVEPAPIVEPLVMTVLIPPIPTLEEVVAATVTIKCVGEGNHEWSGSGAFIDDCGTILTARHVLEGAVVIMIILPDGTIHPAVDPYFLPLVDVGFCKFVGPQPAGFLKLSDTAPRLGDTVRVIGSPAGLVFAGSVSQGIVSCSMRMFDTIEYMQIDASAIPGNSGGPVVNLQGEIVGVLVAGIQIGVEINFAVPVDQVQAMLLCYEAHKNLKAILWHPKPQN